MILEEIASKYERPIIGIVGAISPLPGYDSDDAYRLGHELRRVVEKRGSLFTGGVAGVGVDVYAGIVDYCSQNGVGDKFFVLFPNISDQPSEEYFALAERTKKRTLNVERAGKDMEERRTCVGALADGLVVVNGAEGSIDEVLKGLMFGKEAICLQNSGGAAEVMAKIKKGEIQIPLPLNRELIKPFDSISEAVNYLSNEFLVRYNGVNAK